MTTIKLITIIKAPIETCFDLARDIDFHMISAEETKEKAISGRTIGKCELGDKITWEANHFGIRQKLSVEITKFNKPFFFQDEMTKGVFKKMRHEHFFEQKDGLTTMIDYLHYEAPFGTIGKIFDRVILKNYLTKFLLTRNTALKSKSENN